MPGVPRGVHAAEVVGAVGGGDQRIDLALGAVEGRKAGQLLRDDRDGLGDVVDDDVAVSIFRRLLAAVGADGHRQRVDVLLVPSDHLVTKDGSQNGLKRQPRLRNWSTNYTPFAFML